MSCCTLHVTMLPLKKYCPHHLVNSSYSDACHVVLPMLLCYSWLQLTLNNFHLSNSHSLSFTPICSFSFQLPLSLLLPFISLVKLTHLLSFHSVLPFTPSHSNSLYIHTYIHNLFGKEGFKKRSRGLMWTYYLK